MGLRKYTLMVKKLRWEPAGARLSHGMDFAGQCPMGSQDLLDLVLALLVFCYPCFKLKASLFLLCFLDLLLVGHLHVKLLPVLLGLPVASRC